MESKKHHALVTKIYEYVKGMDSVKGELVQSDIYEVSGNVTRMPEGVVPDVFYEFDNLVIIGEAKTDPDLEEIHSFYQYQSYFNYLRNKSLRGMECIFVMAVPWESTKTALKIIKRFSEDIEVKLVIINELGVYKEI